MQVYRVVSQNRTNATRSSGSEILFGPHIDRLPTATTDDIHPSSQNDRAHVRYCTCALYIRVLSKSLHDKVLHAHSLGVNIFEQVCTCGQRRYRDLCLISLYAAFAGQCPRHCIDGILAACNRYFHREAVVCDGRIETHGIAEYRGYTSASVLEIQGKFPSKRLAGRSIGHRDKCIFELRSIGNRFSRDELHVLYRGPLW